MQLPPLGVKRLDSLKSVNASPRREVPFVLFGDEVASGGVIHYINKVGPDTTSAQSVSRSKGFSKDPP